MKGCERLIDRYDNECCDVQETHDEAVQQVLRHMPPEDELLDLAELFKVFGDTTMFRSRIAHGMLTAGLICPVLTKLCGGASYTYSQEIRFKTAVLLNDAITVQGEVTAVDLEQRRVTIQVTCTKQNAQPGDRPVILATFVQSMDVPVDA